MLSVLTCTHIIRKDTMPDKPLSPWYATVLKRVRELIPLDQGDGDYTLTLDSTLIKVCVKGGKIATIDEA